VVKHRIKQSRFIGKIALKTWPNLLDHYSSLEQIIEWRGKPAAIRCDNGPEYISQILVDWANIQQITLIYIQPGKPTQNAYIERFNRTVRHEWLSLHLFETIEQAQYLATE